MNKIIIFVLNSVCFKHAEHKRFHLYSPVMLRTINEEQISSQAASKERIYNGFCPKWGRQ